MCYKQSNKILLLPVFILYKLKHCQPRFGKSTSSKQVSNLVPNMSTVSLQPNWCLQVSAKYAGGYDEIC